MLIWGKGMKTKIVKKYVDNIAGFPIILSNVEFVFVRSEWVPKINYQLLDRQVLKQLVSIQGRLTGAHIKFIKRYFNMTLKEFAQRFCVSHVAVIKWEKKLNKPTDMAWAIEKDVRLFIQNRISSKAKAFADVYALLEQVPTGQASSICIDRLKVAA